MAILSTDIELRYSGGAANTTAGSALGGAMSTAGGGTVDTGVANDLFDDVSAAEAVTDDVEYRGIYVSIISGATGTLSTARIFISADSSNADDIIDLAIADEAKNVSMETIANESTAPTGPTFSHPTTYAGGIAIDNLVADDERGVWVRRSIDGSPSQADPGAITNTLKVEGTTV